MVAGTPRVAVVGAGPVGLVLALLLARHDVDVVLVESRTAVGDRPRAVNLDDEAARVLQAAGLAGWMRHGLVPFAGMRLVGADGRVRWTLRDTAARGANGYPGANLFFQPHLEAALWRLVGRCDGIEVRRGRTLEGLEPAGDRLGLRLADGGRHHVVDAVVGCDGARSTVRRLTGLPLSRLGRSAQWLLVDLRLHGRPLDLPSSAVVQVCDPRRPRTVVPVAGDRARLEVLLDGRVVPTDVELESLAREWLPDADPRVVDGTPYRYHALVARRWRRGRVLLAGDAAHQMPPFLGQGLASGLRDADDLSWKLAACLHGRASWRLLDTYETERAPQVRGVVRRTLAVGALVRGGRAARAALRLVDTAGRGVPALRRRLEAPAVPRPNADLLRLRPHFPGDDVGRLLPQPTVTVAEGRHRLDDLLPRQIALLAAESVLRDLRDAARDDLRALGAVTHSVDDVPAVRAWLARRRAGAVLIRPDRRVLTLCEGPGHPDAGAAVGELARRLTPLVDRAERATGDTI